MGLGWHDMAGTVRKESTQTAPAITASVSPHKSKSKEKMNAYACAADLLCSLGSVHGSFTGSVTGLPLPVGIWC